MSDYALLNIDQVEKYYERSLDSKKVIEEKLKTSLTSLTLASSFTLAFATIVLSDGFKKQGTVVLYSVGFLLTLAVSYFVASSILALRAMSEKNMIFILNPTDEGQAKHDDKKKHLLAILTELNVNVNIVRQNYMSVSFNCIRNGIILMITIPILLFLSNVFFNKNNDEKDQIPKELNMLNKTISLGFDSIKKSNEKNTIVEREMVYHKLRPELSAK